MDQEQNQMHSAPQLCGNGCGFYGSPSFDGLCSKCHKDSAKREADKTQQGQPAGGGAPLSQVLTETSALLAASSSTSTAQPTVSVLPASSSSSDVTTSSSGGGTAVSAAVTTASSAAPLQADAEVPAEPEPDPERPPAGPEAGAAAGADASESAEPPPKKKSRCGVCRKKVGLTGFTCRCDGLFCSLHRYSDKHDCSFDYRVHGQQEIRKNNPVIVGEKVNKI